MKIISAAVFIMSGCHKKAAMAPPPPPTPTRESPAPPPERPQRTVAEAPPATPARAQPPVVTEHTQPTLAEYSFLILAGVANDPQEGILGPTDLALRVQNITLSALESTSRRKRYSVRLDSVMSITVP
jgi:hypothetical protein